MSEEQIQRRPHVLIMGWDGVRDDVVRAAHTPQLDALAARGFFATVRVHDANPTISGPVWSTMATGVYRDRHGVHDNDFRGNAFDRHPDVLTRVRTALPGATTFAGGAWAPLVEEASGGPLFSGGGYRPAVPADTENTGGIELIATMDEAVTARVARELRHRDHAVVFAYEVLPDMVGHIEGVTDRYRAAVEICDEQLGVLLAAIDARPTRAEEDWTVIVLTDHGHLDAGHHGGDSEEERTAWISAAGPGIPAGSAPLVDHADVLPHVLAAFGLPADPALPGRPFGAHED
ncbi:alkaline phosphatase family protein [Microbacterium sp. ASV81]|uniref:Alkaline phosphatase family protein n=1 Tax=Microbacterium capsulatum TaxID=3041921 RepID=A0ABU0XJM9_9MICO|nr:alkaline phosphatase family protein [Microbacterium sp. ASV81]MDQ4215322.1 alkaline phosphatase family protein [Microbacterium sp. ASV81]